MIMHRTAPLVGAATFDDAGHARANGVGLGHYSGGMHHGHSTETA
jgi:hypothetical protein